MPKLKKFIDKKKAITFHVVHRSQHDPLIVDEKAPQHVLVPVNTETSSKQKTQEELLKYGIYFDDDYNYLQHLRDVNRNRTEVEFIEAPKSVKYEKQKLKLPSSVFASTVEEEVGLLNKAAPESGLRLDLDPDVVAAMDEDFDYSDPDNILEDNFVELANATLSDRSEENTDDENLENIDFHCSDEEIDEAVSLRELDTKSRFTDYSMTSSVISRNSQLTLLDETFEQMFANYDEAEIGALDCDEIEGEIDINSQLLQKAADEFEKERRIETFTVEDIQKVMIDSSEENECDNEYLFEIKDKNKWDCESILSTYSNIYNHPIIIKDSLNRIHINRKTGIPIESGKLTKKALAHLNDSGEKHGPSSVISALSMLSIRNKNESLEEKKIRKKQLKEYRKVRRMERKINKEAFKEEKRKLEKAIACNKLNKQGFIL